MSYEQLDEDYDKLKDKSDKNVANIYGKHMCDFTCISVPNASCIAYAAPNLPQATSAHASNKANAIGLFQKHASPTMFAQKLLSLWCDQFLTQGWLMPPLQAHAGAFAQGPMYGMVLNELIIISAKTTVDFSGGKQFSTWAREHEKVFLKPGWIQWNGTVLVPGTPPATMPAAYDIGMKPGGD